MTWDEVLRRMKFFDLPENKIYGVPRGGMICTAFLNKAKAVTTPEQANIILDDIVDSGATRAKYLKMYPEIPFVALVDKNIPHDAKIGWVIFPWEQDEIASIEDSVIRQLEFIGEDVSREGLLDTPKRVIKSWAKLYGGYSQNPKDVITVFDSAGCDEIVLLKNIEFFSTCEHHMLPFHGKAHIAYLPNKKVIGISKLARLLEVFSRRLQIQERIGVQVTEVLMNDLGAVGAACILEAQHFCMTSRGVEKQNSIMTTSSIKGIFRENLAARNELLNLIAL